jgi:hypothetical protein
MTTTQIDMDASIILKLLAESPRNKYVDREDVSQLSDLPPERVNDAVALLVNSGFAKWIQTFGTAPYDFNAAIITSRGRYEHQRLEADAEQVAARPSFEDAGSIRTAMFPPAPAGSPYGFTDKDWKAISQRKHQSAVLYAVLGHQFDSEHFDRASLRRNVEGMLDRAVETYNSTPDRAQLTLDFQALGAGYGEHLFNEIARGIIGSDIAIFETSDMNPNVMLEMGVALTWGIKVLPIKLQGSPKATIGCIRADLGGLQGQRLIVSRSGARTKAASDD